MPSSVSRGLNGSKITRFEKHGEAGQIVAMVAVSWIEKPVVSSSRCSRLRMPPGLPGVVAHFVVQDPGPMIGHVRSRRRRTECSIVRSLEEDECDGDDGADGIAGS